MGAVLEEAEDPEIGETVREGEEEGDRGWYWVRESWEEGSWKGGGSGGGGEGYACSLTTPSVLHTYPTNYLKLEPDLFASLTTSQRTPFFTNWSLKSGVGLGAWLRTSPGFAGN